MRNYFRKLQVITGSSIRDLLSEATYLSTNIYSLPKMQSCLQKQTLHTGLVNLFAIPTLTLHIRALFCDVPKIRNYLRKASLGQKSKRYIRSEWVKDKRSTVSCLPLFHSAFLLIFFLTHFFGTTNGLQQATAPSNAFQSIQVLSFSSTITVQRHFFYPKRMLFFSKELLLAYSQQKKFYIRRCNLSISKLIATLKVCVKHRADKKTCLRPQRQGIPFVKRTKYSHVLCQKHGTWS